VLLCGAALLAGFTDAIVGGGGLIQTPAGLVLLRQWPLATVIGTLKIPGFTGTSFAAAQYARRVQFNYLQLAVMIGLAFSAAFGGSALLTIVSNHFMKPLLLVIMIAVLIYTLLRKNFGMHTEKNLSARRSWLYLVSISLVLGFYDGFIGPGAGSFLILAFISLLGMDFLRASAHAKFINLATNLGSIVFFAGSHRILYHIALPMAVCNGLGGILGARMALLKGNRFIRYLFLLVITGTIIRFGYDVLLGK